MAILPLAPFQFQHVNHPGSPASFSDPHFKQNMIQTPVDRSMIHSNTLTAPSNGPSTGSKKQKTTPPCDRCRQRRIKCDRLEPTCSSCTKYKASCVRTFFPAGAPLSTVSVDSVGTTGLRILTSVGKRDRDLSEAEVLDSCLRDVQSLQLSRLRRIEMFFDRLNIDEVRLDELGWLAEQIKAQQAGTSAGPTQYTPEEIAEKLGPSTPLSWIKQLSPLLMASNRVQQMPSVTSSTSKSSSSSSGSPARVAIEATLSSSGEFTCPSLEPASFPAKVPLSILNKTMFELSVYDRTEYLGPVAGTRASNWCEEMRFPLPWLIPEPQVDESLLVLPPIECMLELIEWMILSPLYTYFPILTKASILNALSSALPGVEMPSGATEGSHSESGASPENSELPRSITGHVSAVFLLNAILALGAAYRSNAIKTNMTHRLLSNINDKDQSMFNSQVYFNRAQALTLHLLDQPRVSTLQGLLLMMKCPVLPGIQNLYREQACAMALSLGLHRDPAPWTHCQPVIQLRRNIFWCCYVIDASYSLNSGSPERFPDDYITVELPRLPSIELGDDIGEIETENETHRIGFLIEQAKLWRIVKKIRRCGQTSSKRGDIYYEDPHLFNLENSNDPLRRNKEFDSSIPSPMSGYSATSPPLGPSPFGLSKASAPATKPSNWIWRADSARRILDVELAQWQMELPSYLKFDFALTRTSDPCPFLVRVNGLGAMLQIIFNEVLILLHHPFLVLANSQAQGNRDQSTFSPVRQPKAKPGSQSMKSPRSRRSSSSARFPLGNSSLSNDETLGHTSRALSPFFNSCTKAAEAITFLIEHLMRTTPEWLACHNEAESAIHIAERVHVLNVDLSTNAAPGLSTVGNANVTGRNNRSFALNQLRKTRSFKKIVAELDQFTMSDGCKPELMTKEILENGTAREQLVKCMKLLLVQKRGPNYYRLSRSHMGNDGSNTPNRDGLGNERITNEMGQEYLEMKLAFLDQKIWLRYYNVNVQDGMESKDGDENWMEILTPFVAPAEKEFDSDGEDAFDDMQYPFGSASLDEMSAAIFGNNGHSMAEHNASSAEGQGSYLKSDSGHNQWERSSIDSSNGLDEIVNPSQSSTEALMELFSNPNSSGMATYYPNHQQFIDKKELVRDHGNIEPGYDVPVFYTGPFGTQDVSLDGFDRIESSLSLESTSSRGQGNSTSALFQTDQPRRGFHSAPIQLSHAQAPQQVLQQQSPTNNSQYPSHQQQQQSALQHDQRSAYPNFDLNGSSVVPRLNHTITSPIFSAPGSPNHPSRSEASAIALGLIQVSSPVPLQSQSQLSMTPGPYLGLLQEQFASQHVPSQAQGSNPLQVIHALSQSIAPTLGSNGAHQSVRPFYGMPMGGFMAPSLAALPEISRNMQANRSSTPVSAVQRTAFMPSTTLATTTQTSATSWAMETRDNASVAAAYLAKSGSISPALPPSLDSSVPTSPQTQSSYRMMLSSASDPLQGLSNQLNSWEGLSGSGNTSPRIVVPSQTHPISTVATTTTSALNGVLATMDGIEASGLLSGIHGQGHSHISAVPEAPSYSGYATTTNPADPSQLFQSRTAGKDTSGLTGRGFQGQQPIC